ncbi:MAG: sensor histidine kinase [Arcobacteraceae bacterium]|nr:sensor histidine kinase [Arcobacteraceae bacterium]
MKFISLHTKEHYATKIQDLTDELIIVSKSSNIVAYYQNYQTNLLSEEFINHKEHFKIFGYLGENKKPIIKVTKGRINYEIPDIKSKFRKDLLKKATLTPNKVVHSNIIYSKALNKPSILFAMNIVNFFDERMGFIIGMAPVEGIFERNILPTNKGYNYKILDKNNNVVFTSLKNDSLKKVNNNFKDNSLIIDKVKDVEYYIYSKKYDFGKVVVYLPYSYFEDMVHNSIKDNILTVLILVFLSILLIYFVSKRITKPLNQLVDQLNKNGSELKVESNYKDIVILSNTFNNQRKALLDLNKNLEQKVKKEVDKNIKKELQLFEQSKMANMGAMIGNIAHQWRQPLSVISTIASGVKMNQEYDMLDKEEIPKFMDTIIERTTYLSETITTFRNFLKEKKELKEVVLQDRIDISLNIAGVALKDSGIELQINIDYDNPIKITMVAGELTEVVINIINNARDILLEKHIENPWVKLDLAEENNKAIITVEDNGGGIPEDILPNIFDEYFTTKDEDEGTGLGLHMSYQIIVKSLNGNIYAQNTENGAKFFIELSL